MECRTRCAAVCASRHRRGGLGLRCAQFFFSFFPHKTAPAKDRQSRRRVIRIINERVCRADRTYIIRWCSLFVLKKMLRCPRTVPRAFRLYGNTRVLFDFAEERKKNSIIFLFYTCLPQQIGIFRTFFVFFLFRHVLWRKMFGEPVILFIGRLYIRIFGICFRLKKINVHVIQLKKIQPK